MNAIIEPTAVDLTACPPEVLAFDSNAETLWPVFLRRTGISMSVDRSRVIDNESRRAWIIRSFGIPSLQTRLAAASDEIARARVWWREATACSDGDSIPDLTDDTMYYLNPFILTDSLKFTDPRAERLALARQEARATSVRYCQNESKNGKHPIPATVRQGAKYCDTACRQAAYRERAA